MRRLAAREAALLAVPLGAFVVLRAALHSTTAALALSGAIPVALFTVAALRRGSRHPVAFVPLIAFAIALAVAILAGGGAVALKLRDAVLTGLIGLACLGSLAVRRPLLALAFPWLARMRGAESERLLAKAGDPRLRRTLTVVTGILGVTMTLDCATQVVMALTLSTTAFVGAASVVRQVILAAGVAALLLYVQRARRR